MWVADDLAVLLPLLEVSEYMPLENLPIHQESGIFLQTHDVSIAGVKLEKHSHLQKEQKTLLYLVVRKKGGSVVSEEIVKNDAEKPTETAGQAVSQSTDTAVDQQWTEAELESIKNRIMTILETVIDPELGVDIVNLGLIYELDLDQKGHCEIKMTLTAMGCPLADVLTDQIHAAVKEIPEVADVEVKLVWYPAWTTDRMSRYARIALGIR